MVAIIIFYSIDCLKALLMLLFICKKKCAGILYAMLFLNEFCGIALAIAITKIRYCY